MALKPIKSNKRLPMLSMKVLPSGYEKLQAYCIEKDMYITELIRELVQKETGIKL